MPLLPMLAAPHEILGNKFELLESLGHGSFGDVWKARRLVDNAIVALKIPRDTELGEEVLRREPELMQAFDHPNIVQVYGFHTVGSIFVIEMEYVAGYNLG
jgi:serine/threonine protein kinase